MLITIWVFLYPFFVVLLGSWGFTRYVLRLWQINGWKEIKREVIWAFVPLSLATVGGGPPVSGVFFFLIPYERNPYPITDYIPWMDYSLGWILVFAVLHLGWLMWRTKLVPIDKFTGHWSGAMLASLIFLIFGLLVLFTSYQFISASFLLAGVIGMVLTMTIPFRLKTTEK